MGFVYSRRGDIVAAKAASAERLTLDPVDRRRRSPRSTLEVRKTHREDNCPIHRAGSTLGRRPRQCGRQRQPSGRRLAGRRSKPPCHNASNRASIRPSVHSCLGQPSGRQPAGAGDRGKHGGVRVCRQAGPGDPGGAYPDPMLARPFDSGGIQAGDWPQSGVGMESTEAAMQAIASGFHAR